MSCFLKLLKFSFIIFLFFIIIILLYVFFCFMRINVFIYGVTKNRATAGNC